MCWILVKSLIILSSICCLLGSSSLSVYCSVKTAYLDLASLLFLSFCWWWCIRRRGKQSRWTCCCRIQRFERLAALQGKSLLLAEANDLDLLPTVIWIFLFHKPWWSLCPNEKVLLCWCNLLSLLGCMRNSQTCLFKQLCPRILQLAQPQLCFFPLKLCTL